MSYYKQIENNARSYWNAYQAIKKYNSETSPNVDLMAIGPDIVVISFCCELYLKSLQSLCGFQSRLIGKDRHNTFFLFNELPEEIQNEIYHVWNKLTGERDTQEQFLNILQHQQNSFQEWRYRHEPRPKVTDYPSAANGLLFGVTAAECFVAAMDIVIRQIENTERSKNLLTLTGI